MTETTPITNPATLGVTMTPGITASPQVGQFAYNTPEPLPFQDSVAVSDLTTAPGPFQISVPPRHPGVTGILRHFEFKHLPEHLQKVSKEFHALAHLMVGLIEDDPELVAGLRKLLEAKDCMVRAAIARK